jgi:hypothetical protein
MQGVGAMFRPVVLILGPEAAIGFAAGSRTGAPTLSHPETRPASAGAESGNAPVDEHVAEGQPAPPSAAL